MLLLQLAANPAAACGGFFCSGGTTTTTTTITGDYGTVPVVQDAERILFRVNEDASITTFVEVNFEQREDVEFAWIIPIPDVIPVDQISTTDAGLFNALEEATAPRFTFQWTQQNVNYGYSSSYGYGYGNGGRSGGCGCGMGSKDSATGGAWSSSSAPSGTVFGEEEAAVSVVDEAVVGPFAIEVITASDAVEFATWLAANGYDLPDSANDPLQHYIDLEMAFLGVKLAPDVPEGPVDTLVFTCPAEAPAIPLILTSIASANALTIQSWILADVPYVPTTWQIAEDIAPATLPDGSGGTTYLALAEAAVSAFSGRAFVLEYAGPTAPLYFAEPLHSATVHQFAYLTRYRGVIAPWEMTVDPAFGPFPWLPDYSNQHLVEVDGEPATASGSGAWVFLLPLPFVALALRRRERG